MRVKFYNQGQSLIGVIAVLITVGLITGGLYYYFQRQIPEVPEITEKPTEELTKLEKEGVMPLLKEELAKKEPPPPEKIVEKKIPEEIVAVLPPTGTKIIEEPIIFAVNKSYAAKVPQWRERAGSIIATVNSVFAKTTLKRFRINKYLTYPDAEYTNIFTLPDQYPEYYHSFGEQGGITYVMLIHKDGVSNEELKQLYGSDNVNLAMPVWKGNKEHSFLLQGAPESYNLLIPEPDLSWFYMPIHEFGHFQGAAVPDQYLYRYSDASGVEPEFGDYAIHEDSFFQFDPMAIEGGVGTSAVWTFSALNTAVINRNLDRQYSSEYVRTKWFAKTTKIKVVSGDGTPMQGATVKVFGVRRGCWFCFTNASGVRWDGGVSSSSVPLQTLTTNSSGIAIYDGPVGAWHFNEREDTPFIAKAIKVYHGGKSAVKVVNFLDLQRAYILDGKDEHIATLILK